VAIASFLFLQFDIADARPYLPLAFVLTLPGIIYTIQTAFTPVVVVGENIAYRAGLQRSKDAVKGHFWQTVGTLVLLFIILFAIPFGIIAVATSPLGDTFAQWVIVSIADNLWLAFGMILINLCLIRMYEGYRVKPGK